jgi:hypothetical protein
MFCTYGVNILSTTAQLAAIQRKVEGEKETLEQQREKVSPGV